MENSGRTLCWVPKIDPKVVMDQSMCKTGGWNILQPSIRKLLEDGIEENDSHVLSIKNPSRDLFLTIQYLERQLMCDDQNVKGSKPLREVLHCAASNDLHEHPRRHSLWKDSVKMEYSKIRSESSECTWNAKAIVIHLQDYLKLLVQFGREIG